jgi:hypothetical protein
MLAVYYICERVLFGSWVIPLASIPGNMVQNVVGIVITIPVCVLLKKCRFLNNSLKKRTENNDFPFKRKRQKMPT